MSWLPELKQIPSPHTTATLLLHLVGFLWSILYNYLLLVYLFYEHFLPRTWFSICPLYPCQTHSPLFSPLSITQFPGSLDSCCSLSMGSTCRNPEQGGEGGEGIFSPFPLCFGVTSLVSGGVPPPWWLLLGSPSSITPALHTSSSQSLLKASSFELWWGVGVNSVSSLDLERHLPPGGKLHVGTEHTSALLTSARDPAHSLVWRRCLISICGITIISFHQKNNQNSKIIRHHCFCPLNYQK